MMRKTGGGLVRASPFPKKFVFRTRYVETFLNLDPGAGGAPSTYIFGLNRLYDPNVTGTGHQPLGFDQVMTMYNHFNVIGARARISFSNTDTTLQQIVCAHIKDNTTPVTDVNDLLENGMNRWTTLQPHGAGGATKNLQINWSAKRFFGRSPMDDTFRGNASSDPSEQAHLHLTAWPVSASDGGVIKFAIEIEYIAVLTERKVLAGS